MYEKYKVIYKVNATNINKVINEINKIYNDTYHSSIYEKPKNMFNKPLNFDKNIKNEKTNEKLKIGDYVRVYIRDDNKQFNKLTPLWSKEIYKIESYNIKNGYYTVNNKIFKYNELQKVNKNNLIKYNKRY